MKVNIGLVLNDDQLRTIRAALGRGGVATRKECRYFVERAIEAAFKKAPEPKPKRRPVPKKVVVVPPVVTEDEEIIEGRKIREKIRKMYRISSAPEDLGIQPVATAKAKWAK